MNIQPEVQNPIKTKVVEKTADQQIAFTSFFLHSTLLFMLLLAGGTPLFAGDKASTSYIPISSKNPAIALDQLELMLEPMTSDELFVEADGWLELLKTASKKVATIRIAVKKKNIEIAAQKEKESNETTEHVKQKIDKSVEAVEEKKVDILEELTKLREERKKISDRLNLVLIAINEKIGTDKEGKELAEVLPYRRYIKAVSGLKVDVTDTKSAWKNITGWLMSDEGGIRWLINISIFIAILFASWIISLIMRNAAKRALEFSPSNSRLLNDFIVNIIHKVVMLIGLIIGLSALEINIGPVMAVVGAAGFVVAFALQGTLSNFASGLMIMFYRPFDVDDIVEVAGILGTVESMTLVSTSIMTLDNRLMIVPNNTIWGNIITNVTHSDKRRVDMVFGIGYDDDIEHAQQVMEKILSDHPLVLKDPEPVIKLHELGDSSVNFVCRPWVKTADYWTVYWEVTRAVKERFDKEGISIPYPQSDIHIFQPNAQIEKPADKDSKAAYSSKPAESIDIRKMDTESGD